MLEGFLIIIGLFIAVFALAALVDNCRTLIKVEPQLTKVELNEMYHSLKYRTTPILKADGSVTLRKERRGV